MTLDRRPQLRVVPNTARNEEDRVEVEGKVNRRIKLVIIFAACAVLAVARREFLIDSVGAYPILWRVLGFPCSMPPP
jgi:hypothetical protein